MSVCECELLIAHPDGRVQASIDAVMVGALDYRREAGRLSVLMIFVAPPWRHRGIAAAMVQFLQRQYPGVTIVSAGPRCHLSAWLAPRAEWP